MGQKKSRHSLISSLDESILRRITSATSFLPDEIHYFYYDFLKYTPKGYLTLEDFEKFYQLLFRHGEPGNFAKYVFNAYDTNRDNIVDFEEFITGLYYTTKAPPNDKVRWAFDLCDRNIDHQLDVTEFENMIEALYELSDPDMARIETFDEAVDRVKQSFLSNPDDHESTELRDSVTKSEFLNIVQNDETIMKLIDCRSPLNRRANKFENSRKISLKKFKPSLHKSLSDSRLTAPNEND